MGEKQGDKEKGGGGDTEGDGDGERGESAEFRMRNGKIRRMNADG